MSDYKFPELPSDEELGITKEDREKYEQDLPDDGPELSAAEMAALLGDVPRPSGGAAAGAAAGSGGRKDAGSPKKDAGSAKKAARAAAKEKKRAERAARAAAKQAEKDRKAAAKAAAKQAGGTATAAAGSGGKASAMPEGASPPKGAPAGESPKGPPTGGSDTEASGDSADHGSAGALRPLLTAAAIAATLIFASTRTGLPDPLPASAPQDQFSSARAMATLAEIAREAHPTGSPEHARVRELLVGRLRALGLEPEVQTTVSVVERPGAARAATVRNIIARVPGTAPTGTVLVTAHYDSREIAVGAADDGSGVVAILEAVRAIRTGDPLRNDLIVLFTDAEELGLLGARAFVAESPLMADVDLVLSFEMRGGGGPSIMFETNEDNGWVVRTLKEWDEHPFANSMAYEIYRRMPNDTDFTPFREAGVQGLNFAGIDNAHVYHQVYDRPENLSEATLQHHGLHALGALRYYGAADLTAVDDDNVVYFTVPLLGLIVYDQIWVLPIAGLLTLLLGAATLAARRGGARWARIAAGGTVAVVIALASYGTGHGLFRWLSSRHEELGALHGSAFHSEGWYLLAIGFTVLGITLALTTLARRWLSLVELSLGALVLPVVAAVGLSAATPLAAMNLQWPALAATVSVLLIALLGARAEAMVGWLVALLLAVPVLVMLEPLVELVWLALSFRLAGVLAVILAVMLSLCLPALAVFRHPNRWWAPLASFGLAAALLGFGLFGARASADRPAPTTLAYAYEHGTGDAVWVTSPGNAAAGSADEASAWARERTGVDFSQTRDMSAFGFFTGDVPVASAPVVSAEAPSVTVVADSVFGGSRHVTLHVQSRIGAEAVTFRMDEGVVTRSINGRPLTESRPRIVEHWGVPEGDIVLELALPPGRPIGVHVVEHLLRPEEVLEAHFFARPPDLAPNVNRLSDRAIFRFSVGGLADPQHAITVPAVADSTATPADTVGAAVDTIGSAQEPIAATVDTIGSAEEPIAATVDTIGSAEEPSAAPVDSAGPIVDTVRPAVDTLGVAAGRAGPVADTRRPALASIGPSADATDSTTDRGRGRR